jgi:hypothetical protein
MSSEAISSLDACLGTSPDWSSFKFMRAFEMQNTHMLGLASLAHTIQKSTYCVKLQLCPMRSRCADYLEHTQCCQRPWVTFLLGLCPYRVGCLSVSRRLSLLDTMPNGDVLTIHAEFRGISKRCSCTQHFGVVNVREALSPSNEGAIPRHFEREKEE